MSRGGVEDRPGMGEDKKDFFCAFGDTKEGADNV